MSLGKVLVPLDGSDQDSILLTTAIRAAKPFNAHVAVLFAHADPAEALPIIGVPLTAEAMSAVIDGNRRIFRAKAKRIHDTIARACAAEGARLVAAPCRDETVTLSFREAAGYPPTVIGMSAALTDLVVCGPAGSAPGAFETAIDIVLHERRPILLAASPPSAFRKVMIGWNDTIPAAHGLLAAMPFLEKAEIIELVCLEQPSAPNFDTGHVCAYFKAHGIAFSELHLRILGSAQHVALAKFARDHRADLMVIGGFSHSRVRETLLGGVTSEILHEPPLPVLLAH
jgi:nucleotide-binding universal stress UspA family protein